MQAIRRYSDGGSHPTTFTGPKGDDMSRQNKAVEQILQSMTLQSDDKKRDQFDTMDLLNILGASGASEKRVNPYEPGTAEYSFFEDPSLKEQFPEEYAKANIQTDPLRNVIAYRDDEGNVSYKILKSTDKKGRGRYQDAKNLTREQIQMLTSSELDDRQISQMQDYINNPRFGESVIQYLLGIDEEEPDVKKFKPRIARNVGGKSGNIGSGTTGGKGSTEYNWFQSFCDRMKRHPSCR